MSLRPYQEAALSALYEYLKAQDQNPCVVIPTGGGKTHVIAKLCADAVAWGSRVLILAHRKELLEQNAEKIGLYAPDVGVGIYSAALGRRDRHAPVIVAGIASVYQRSQALGKFDIVVVDEAHLIPTDGEGMYRTLLVSLREANPILRVIGFTATPYRMSTGWICSERNILNEICYEISVKDLIDQGHLCQLVSKSALEANIADTSNVRTRAGEFVAQDLEAVFSSDAHKVSCAVKETISYARDRKKCLIFACGIVHAAMIQRALKDQGETEIGFVCGETPEILRADLISRFREGSLKWLVNVNVLTEGFDAPNIDLIALMRATKSPGLYYQMVGRGLRICEGKANCMILDFGENVIRHGTVDQVVPTEEAEGGEAPTKTCPACREIIAMGCLTCPSCGHTFEAPAEKDVARHEAEASDAPILKSWKTEWHTVQYVTYAPHSKRAAPPGHPQTLKVTYNVGFQQTYCEWVCIEHEVGSYARGRASGWWASRSKVPFPRSAAEAAQIAQAGWLRVPLRIKVKEDEPRKELPKILEVEFNGAEYPDRSAGDEELEVASVEAIPQTLMEEMGLESDEVPF